MPTTHAHSFFSFVWLLWVLLSFAFKQTRKKQKILGVSGQVQPLWFNLGTHSLRLSLTLSLSQAEKSLDKAIMPGISWRL
mmetsp:Transcript_4848/g.8774  ORF Transcript_4848/g.8774 Transcript_4848/m.8774 type:complete len:80 (-) Transcript_4848:541-780(-)